MTIGLLIGSCGSITNAICYFILISPCFSKKFVKNEKDEKLKLGCMKIVINTAQEYREVK